MSMPISEILARIISNIDQAEPVSLSPGQLISLLVKQIEGNQAVLTYQGKLLLAQLETALTPGERIRCMVEGEKDGKLVLKLLSEPGCTTEELKSGGVEGLLKEMDLPVNGLNKQIIQELVRQELPITRENLQSLVRMVRETGAAPEDLDVLTFCHKNGISMEPKNFELVRAAIKDKAFMSAPLEDLRRQLSNLVREMPAGSEVKTVAEKIINLIENMTISKGDTVLQLQDKLALIPRMLGSAPGQGVGIPDGLAGKDGRGLLRLLTGEDLRPGSTAPVASNGGAAAQATQEGGIAAQATAAQGGATSSENVTPGFAESAKAVPAPGETRLPGTVLSENDVPDNTAILNNTDAPKNTAALGGDKAAPGPALHDAAATVITVHPKDNAAIIADGRTDDKTAPKEPAGNFIPQAADKEIAVFAKELLKLIGIKHSAPTEEQLPALLNKLHELVKGEEAAEKPLLALINTVQERLSTLENLQRPTGPNQDGIFLMQSMFRSGEENYPLEMLVRYRKDEKSDILDFARCHVYVTLTTGSLGKVQATLQVSGRNLNCRFTSENEKARQTIDKWLPDLVTKLAELDYNVTMLPSQVREEQTSAVLSPVNDRSGKAFYQVDITV